MKHNDNLRQKVQVVLNVYDQLLQKNPSLNIHFVLTDLTNELKTFHTGANIVDLLAHISTAVYDHWKILDTNKNWVRLCFLELFYIKQLKAKINDGLKASKELLLFR